MSIINNKWRIWLLGVVDGWLKNGFVIELLLSSVCFSWMLLQAQDNTSEECCLNKCFVNNLLEATVIWGFGHYNTGSALEVVG